MSEMKPNSKQPGLLDGIRVIEIGQVLSAPYAAMVLGDLGAEVLKIEKPDGGDDARRMGEAYRGQDSLTFMEINRNKHSVVLDLKTAEGLSQFHALLATADILVHNLRPGIAEEIGIDGANLCEHYPRLIYCEISGFGDRGPLSGAGGFEPIAQAFSGLISVNGHPSAPSARVGASVVDIGTAMWIVIGAISALYKREKTGSGGLITGSLLETSITWVGSHMAGYLNQGRRPTRLGTANAMLVPYQAFAALDGEVLIAAGNDRLFKKLVGVLGHPEWGQDDRFATNRGRLNNRATIVDLINDVVATKEKSYWFTELSKIGVPCAPVNTISEATAEPQVKALDILQVVPGTQTVVAALPLRYNGVRPPLRFAAPELGADNGILDTTAHRLKTAVDRGYGDKS